MAEPSALRPDPRFAIRDLLIAAAFLTRLPLGSFLEGEAFRPLAAVSWALPVVGLGLGLVGGLAYGLAQHLGVPVLAAALIAVAVTVLITGGLHEDGLADTADGFGGGATREAKLDIMRDSRSGAFGVLALIFSVGLRVTSIGALAEVGAVISTLVAGHAVSRGILPGLMHYLDPARSEGLGADAGKPDFQGAALALGIATLAAFLCLGLRQGFCAVLLAVLGVAAIGWLARRHIGGHTGDVLGASQQVAEVIVLLVAASWAA